MIDGKMLEADLEKMNRINSLLDRNKATYGAAVLKTVIAKQQGEWSNSFTLLKVTHREEEPIKDETYRYPNFLIANRSLTRDELVKMIEELVTNAKFKVKDLVEIPLEGYFFSDPWYDYIPSNDRTFNLSWPANAFIFRPKTEGRFPVEPFVALDAPLFAGPWEVLRLWTGIDFSGRTQFIGSIAIVLSNFDARIEELRLSPGLLSIRIQTQETTVDKLLGKLYCEKSGGSVLQQDISFDKDEVTVPITFVPDWWQFYLLSKATGEILDFRKVHATWESLPAGVKIEIGSADIEEILKRGENEHIEFKREIQNPNELIETVAAFANTSGGSIFVGIDDNGKVIGTSEHRVETGDQNKFEERIQNMLRSHCEPTPEIKVERKELQNKTIYVIQVPEGKDKPYNNRDRGFFVRAGSTDRLATRIEMDQYYQERQAPYGHLDRRLY